MKKLRPYQEKMLEYAKTKARIAFFVEMRLGKSIPTIRWVKAEKEIRDCLILGPKSALPGWKKELMEEGIKEHRIIDLYSSTEDRYEIANALCQGKVNRWYLMNYEAFVNGLDLFKIRWDCVICDESTKIRNPQSEISKNLIKYTDTIRYRAILSGCPAPESPLDYVQQMLFIHGSFMNCCTYWEWRAKYCYKVGYNWEFNPTFTNRLKEELENLTFTLSRKDAGMKEEKIREIRYVEMNDKQKVLYEDVKNDFEFKMGKDFKSTKWAPVAFNWLQRIATGFDPNGVNISNERVYDLYDLINSELKNESIVIWCKHNDEIEYLAHHLRSERCKDIAWYTGQSKYGEEEFKAGKYKVMIAQPKAAMQALDWSVASVAIYFSNWCDGEIRIQSEDRILNVARKEPLLYIDYCTKDTIDEHIVELVNQKKTQSETYMNKQLFERMKNGFSEKRLNSQ